MKITHLNIDTESICSGTGGSACCKILGTKFNEIELRW